MITAKIIQDSVYKGKRITTFELEYPRFIHSEFMTHRVFSRNAASSRAIPIDAMHRQILADPAMPVSWGKNQPGMQAKEDLPPEHTEIAKQIWAKACKDAVHWSSKLANLGAHKQIANRITEPFMNMKTVMTTTQVENWFWLRNHTDADPTIHELAKVMLEAMDNSTPMELVSGEWHVPYIHREIVENKLTYSTNNTLLTLEEAKKVSASCCAQVSYRKNDDSLEKALMIYDKLINSSPQHASPIEHQATPITKTHLSDCYNPKDWEKGVTHVDRWGGYWSGNFQGWVQFRQFI